MMGYYRRGSSSQHKHFEMFTPIPHATPHCHTPQCHCTRSPQHDQCILGQLRTTHTMNVTHSCNNQTKNQLKLLENVTIIYVYRLPCSNALRAHSEFTLRETSRETSRENSNNYHMSKHLPSSLL